MTSPHDLSADPDATSVEWSHFDLFRGMDVLVIRTLIDTMEPFEAEPGDVLITQGEPGDEMFLLQEGEVDVRIADHEGDVVMERELLAPAIFGEMALVTRDPRTASVIARTACKCLRVGKKSFLQLVRKNPPAAAFLTHAVGRRLMDSAGIKQVGKYKVLGHLGKGGLATVFEAVHPELGQRVALKMLWHHFVLRRGFAEAFKREARLIAKLNHDHIVRVIDTEKAYGTHFIVMERLVGQGLDELVERDGKLPAKVVRRVLVEILGALGHCHEHGLLHRDVKPSNIYITDRGQAKLLDFNIAVDAEAARAATGRAVGTPNFMAPEQVLGQPLDARTDIYALGITAYQILTGEVPFEAETIDELREHQVVTPLPDPRVSVPDLPEDLAAFILRATRKDPADRYATCEQAVQTLRAYTELPFVDKLEVSSIAVTYHPSRKAAVGKALRSLYNTLRDMPGVSVAVGHHHGRDVDQD